MSVDIHDIIKYATFCDDRLRGLGVERGRISRFPIDLRRHPYNTLALPCECVMVNIILIIFRLPRSYLTICTRSLVVVQSIYSVYAIYLINIMQIIHCNT